MMAHLLFCRLVDKACTADDLATITLQSRQRHVPASGRKLCEGHDRTLSEEDLLISPKLSAVQFSDG